MTIEITHGQSRYQFRIVKKNPLVVERRLNKDNARWFYFLRRDSPQEAKRAMLRLMEEEGVDHDQGI